MNIILEGKNLQVSHALALDSLTRIWHAQGSVSEHHLAELESPLTGENPQILLDLPQCELEATEVLDAIEANGIPFHVGLAIRNHSIVAITHIASNP